MNASEFDKKVLSRFDFSYSAYFTPDQRDDFYNTAQIKVFEKYVAMGQVNQALSQLQPLIKQSSGAPTTTSSLILPIGYYDLIRLKLQYNTDGGLRASSLSKDSNVYSPFYKDREEEPRYRFMNDGVNDILQFLPNGVTNYLMEYYIKPTDIDLTLNPTAEIELGISLQEEMVSLAELIMKQTIREQSGE